MATAERVLTAKQRAVAWAILFPGVILGVWWTATMRAGKGREWLVVGTLLALWIGFCILTVEWPPRASARRVDGLPALTFPGWRRWLAPLLVPAFFLFAAWAGAKQPERPWLAPFGYGAYVFFALVAWLDVRALVLWGDQGIERRGLYSSLVVNWAEVASIRAVSTTTFLVATSWGQRFHVSLAADGAPEFSADLLVRLPKAVLQQSPGVVAMLEKSARQFSQRSPEESVTGSSRSPH